MTVSVAERVAALPWGELDAALSRLGYAATAPVLTTDECAGLREAFDHDARFRSRIDMARYRFGQGRYAYFEHPLPELVRALRESLYARLAPLANEHAARLGLDTRYPDRLDDYLAACHAGGQQRPTPLLLRYGPDDYNCLHQDLYGELAFPLQAMALLSEPGIEFEGGEFLVYEQRPRAQSRCEAVSVARGGLVIFFNALRPVPGARGFVRVNMRHGVSRVRSGERMALGIIFHDAA